MVLFVDTVEVLIHVGADLRISHEQLRFSKQHITSVSPLLRSQTIILNGGTQAILLHLKHFLNLKLPGVGQVPARVMQPSALSATTNQAEKQLVPASTGRGVG